MTSLDRRQFLAQTAAGLASTSAATPDAGPAATSATASSTASPRPAALAEPVFAPLPLGAVRPAGWLRRQMRIQAEGLSGHLDLFWPDVAQSQWFGGTAEGWERAPYWLDGAIPLAWLLDDVVLKTRITAHMDYIITRQRGDGWFSPYPTDAVTRRYDL